MVSVFLFALHIVAAAYAFFHYRKESVAQGLLAVGFVAIIFSVGWTIATMLINLLFSVRAFSDWFYGETSSLFLQALRSELNRDALSLLLLTTGEVGFYYFFLKRDAGSRQTTT